MVYFSTYTPTELSSATACSDGFGSVWGVDFRLADTGNMGPYPKARLAEDPNASTIIYVHEIEQDPGIVVFGVSVTQVPSCYETAPVTDPFTGAQHDAISKATPPQYQLVFHTGAGGSSQQGSKTNTKTQVLPSPREMAKIDSWASILE